MLKKFSKCLTVLILISFAGRVDGTAKSCGLPLPQFCADDPVLTVTQPTPLTALMSWAAFGTAGPYTVTVTDLTTSKQFTTFNTTNTSATIPGLTGGHTYRFEVSRSSQSGIIELIVTG